MFDLYGVAAFGVCVCVCVCGGGVIAILVSRYMSFKLFIREQANPRYGYSIKPISLNKVKGRVGRVRPHTITRYPRMGVKSLALISKSSDFTASLSGLECRSTKNTGTHLLWACR